MRVSEFDAFGPWVYEVDEEHPLPPLFAPCVERPEQYRMLLKIPREIERRKATPDMDLYDYVIGADEVGVHIWSRRDKQVRAVEIPYGDISGVRLYQRLLQGFLTIYGPAGESVMPYNTVSAGLLRKFVRLLRGEFRTDPACLPEKLAGDPALRETDIDIWLFNQMGRTSPWTPTSPSGVPPGWDGTCPGSGQGSSPAPCISTLPGSCCCCAAARPPKRKSRSTARS